MCGHFNSSDGCPVQSYFHDARYVGLYNELYRIDPAAIGADHVGQCLNRCTPTGTDRRLLKLM